MFLVGREAICVAVVKHEPAAVSPQKGDERAVWIILMIRVVVVTTMGRDPARWRVFHAAQCDDDEEVLEPLWKFGCFMREDAVIAQIYSLAKDEDANDHDND